MNRRNGWLLAAVAVVAGVSVFLLAATYAAPTTEHLIIQAVGHEGLADDGNRAEASLIVSIYNAAGPITGMAGGSFSVKTAATPTGGFLLKKSAVTEVGAGIYQITLVPDTASQSGAVWKRGQYVVGVTLTSPNGSGTAVASLSVDL
jgi:hypothetical protein